MQANLIIWDWLGTIEKSDNAHFFVMNKLLYKHTGKSFDTKESLDKYWHEISFAVQNVIKAEFPIELEKCSTWIAPYAISLFKYFKERNIPQCIISNGRRDEIQRKINELNLDYFDIIIGNEDGFALKPNPSSILHLCKKYKLKNDQNIWMIGDSKEDMEFAMHAQIKGLHVKNDLTVVWNEIENEEESQK